MLNEKSLVTVLLILSAVCFHQMKAFAHDYYSLEIGE